MVSQFFSGHMIRFFLLFYVLFFTACSTSADNTNVRKPAVAGSFYTSNAAELKEQIEYFLSKVEKKEVTGNIVAGIVPHAGYVFSGQVAAYTYKYIQGLDFDTVILVGPCHRTYDVGLNGISVYQTGFYKTPLGLVEINTKLAREFLAEGGPFTYLPAAHKAEHCLEVQLPFLQTVLKKFTIVPILLGRGPGIEIALAKALKKHLANKKALVLASTDLTHYPPYEVARQVDLRSLELIRSLDTASLRKHDRTMLSSGKPNLHCTLCGLNAVIAVMEYSKQVSATDVKILKYANSGDVPVGGKNRVVGYGSVLFLGTDQAQRKEDDSQFSESSGAVDERDIINEAVGKELLLISRKTLQQYSTTQKIPELIKRKQPYTNKRGVFVTLKMNGKLRGCIGHIFPVEPLERAVISNTINAACKDPRFPAVRPSEVKTISIEISVLSVPKKIDSLAEFILGKHGIILKKGRHQAVYLPQVAPEQGWDKATTLFHLSRKAGLPSDGWQKGAVFYVFEAQIFHEHG